MQCAKNPSMSYELATLARVLCLAWCAYVALPSAAARAEAEPAQTDPGFRPSSAPFGQSLCLGVKFSQQQPHSDLPMLQDLGVRWVRDFVGWPELEPKPGKYAVFPAPFRERLKYYRAHKIGVVFLLAYDNAKAYPNDPEHPHRSVDPEAFARFAVHAARQLRAAGVSFKLELWNEPHNFVLRDMIGGNWQARPPSAWADHYVELARATVRAVHAFDPKVTVLTNEDSWVAHYWFLERGLPSELGGFAVHPYSQTSPFPERTPVGPKDEWTQPFSVVDDDRSFRSAVRRLREQAEQKLHKVPELWLTEFGWKVGEQTEAGPIDELKLAAFLPRSYVIAAAAGAHGMCWFSARDSVDGPVGLLDNNGRRRPSYATYRTMAYELGSLRLTQQLLGLQQPTRGVQAFSFADKRLQRTVAWTIEGEAIVELTPAKGAQIAVRDMFGAAVELTPVAAGKQRATIGYEPIYIDGLDPAPGRGIRVVPPE
jgi:hypothetical protein